MTDVCPIVAEKHFDHISVPKADVGLAVVGRQEQIQNLVRALKQEIEVLIRPIRANYGSDLWIIDLAAAVHRHRLPGRILPDFVAGI